jgi:phosphoribosylcarboxyaminoimidazole (NCAIR) mutase
MLHHLLGMFEFLHMATVIGVPRAKRQQALDESTLQVPIGSTLATVTAKVIHESQSKTVWE